MKSASDRLWIAYSGRSCPARRRTAAEGAGSAIRRRAREERRRPQAGAMLHARVLVVERIQGGVAQRPFSIRRALSWVAWNAADTSGDERAISTAWALPAPGRV